MAVLVDTNILLRLLQPHHLHCQIAERALNVLRARNEVLNVTIQNLIEFWAAATRPVGENGLGFDIDRTAKELDDVKRLFVLLPEVPTGEEWERLVKIHQVLGRNTHDARLAAAMHVHGIDRILTYNVRDFSRYAGITALDPKTLV